jgi:glycosyltransferase involved in cell wall biosynthesis
MKICLVTTFPPSTGGLSEYGFHIAQELQRNPFLNLIVLGDELPTGHTEPEGFTVVRCWSFDDVGSTRRILRELRRLKPDVVWFNLLFSTFGRNPLIAFSGLMTPLLARLSGRYTHVTLHHLMDTVELKDVGIRHEGLYRFAGALATRMILLSNSVSVLMPGYRKILNDKYGRDNVHLRAHGILTRRPEFPDFSRRGNPEHRILAFGKWGTYKRLELMIEAFKLMCSRMPNAKLVIAGSDHPQAKGYTASVQQKCAGDDRIEFRGYVQEEALADLFQSATVAVMPYSSSTGCSGVAHLACAYGVPIVSADLPDFRQMAAGEELAIEFFPPGDAQGLADCLVRLLQNPEKLKTMAAENFASALRMTMPNVVQKYLRHFELQQRVQTLRYISRVRRLPRWVPSKSLLLRLMTRNSLGWARRSAILHSAYIPHELRLVHGNGNGRRDMDGVAGSLNGNNAGYSGEVPSESAEALASAAGISDEMSHRPENSDQRDDSHAVDAAYEPEAKNGEAEGANAKTQLSSIARLRDTDDSRLPRESGFNGNGVRSDGSRKERTA